MTPTFVIGEMGSTHDRNFSNACRLIEIAKDAGCNAVKAQYWSSAERMAERRRAQDYLDIYKRYQIPAGWLPNLRQYADRVGIELMCTSYLPEDVGLVAQYVQRFKIASFESSDLAFVKAHRRFNLPVICSVGMLSAFDAMLLAPYVDTVLHCVSAYPTPSTEANLNAIISLRQQLQVPVGYSDHTGLELTGALAVMVGAVALEVHFALDTTDPLNPDVACALSPASLRHYVRNVRLAEAMAGDGEKRQMECEAPMAKYKVKA